MNYHKQAIQHEITNLNGFLAGFLVGSVVGAGTMLFLAPQSGKKTRAIIERKGRELSRETSETLADGADQVRAKAHEVTTNLQDQVEELQQHGQDMVDAQKERWVPAVEAGKTAVKGS